MDFGSAIHMSASTKGGTQPYRYMFYYKDEYGEEHTIEGYSYKSNTKYSFSSSGRYTLGVRVKDADDVVIEKEIADFQVNSFENALVSKDYPVLSNNKNKNNYTVWADVVNSYLVENEDHTFSRIECYKKEISVENYDEAFQFQSGIIIPFELSKFGGFYSGKTYNFIVFGQENAEESGRGEVVRVVRYTKDWIRVDSCSIYGANTTNPFYAGSLRMVESLGTLYVHTSHLMYASDDGFNHQANLNFSINISTMKLARISCGVATDNFYVSHSLNQYILATDNGIIKTLDHGDAYPRAITIGGYNGGTKVFNIEGKTGANATGVSIGGFEYSDNCYLVAGNSVVQSSSGSYNADAARNIFVTATSRLQNTTNVRWITKYKNADNIEVSTPQFVKLDNSKFMILWSEGDIVKYTFVDGNGNASGQIYSSEASLSDCKPILSGEKVVWYVTNGEGLIFYTIDINNPTEISQSERIRYQINYYLNGGENNADNPETYVCGKDVEIKNPTKSGYKFVGWYTDALCSQKLSDIGNDTYGDIDLYAKWDIIEYSINYNLNGGEVSGNLEKYTVETETFMLANPVRKGYNFIGWISIDMSTPQTEVIIEKGSIGDKKYSAKWQREQYSINYYLNGGENHIYNPSSYIYGYSNSFYNPVRKGYCFVGWYTDEALTDRISGISEEMYGDINLYAKWEAVEYPITYHLNGGEVSGNPETYTVEMETFTLVNPVKEGYRFCGWTGSNGTTPQVDLQIEKGTEGELKYTAKWEKIPIYIEEITISPDFVELTVGDTKKLSVNIAPVDADNQRVEWSSTDSAIVTVDQEGKITALEAGNAVVIVQAQDRGTIAVCKITVNEKQQPTTQQQTTQQQTTQQQTTQQQTTQQQTTQQQTTQQQTTQQQNNISTEIEVENLIVKEKIVTLEVEQSKNIEVTNTSLNIAAEQLMYTSSNEAVATVDANGKIKAVAPGVVNVTIENVNGISTEVIVKVKPVKVTSLKKTKLSKTKVKISWKKQSNVTGYKVYRLNAKTKKYVLYKTTKYNYVSVAKLKKNTTYTFKVKAYKRSGTTVVNGDTSKAFKVKIK